MKKTIVLLLCMVTFSMNAYASRVVIVGSGGIDFQENPSLKAFPLGTLPQEFTGAVDGWNAFTGKSTTYQQWFRDSVQTNYSAIKNVIDLWAAGQAGDAQANALFDANGGNNDYNNSFNYYFWPYNVTEEALLIASRAPGTTFQGINFDDMIFDSDTAVGLPHVPTPALARRSGTFTTAEIFDTVNRYLTAAHPQIAKLDYAYYPGSLSASDSAHVCQIITDHPEIFFVVPVGFAGNGATGTEETNAANTPVPASCAAGLPNAITVTLADAHGGLPQNADSGATVVDVASWGLDVPNPTQFGTDIKLFGTCVATDFVTASAANVLDTQPGLTPGEIKAAVLAAATPVGALAGKVRSGSFVSP